ncbi:MAG: (Fe-S)-binding protein, partial [Thermoplasmataceae archaeon]
TAIRKLVYGNLMETYLPFPVDLKASSKWASEAGVPHNTDSIIFTSHMYQMGSMFKNYEKYIPLFTRLGGSKMMASVGSRLIRTDRSDAERSARILKNIYSMLLKSGIKCGYLYEDEPYSGSLLLELGFLDEFMKYGKKLQSLFKSKGVKRIYTVDPHTTNSLANLRKMIGFDIEFTPYLNVISGMAGSGKFVLHDSCLYSRFLGMYSDVRSTARNSGIELLENPNVTGKSTSFCCGGPIGPIDAGISTEVARLRVKQLNTVSDSILVVCPLCYENLSEFGNVKDIAEVMA